MLAIEVSFLHGVLRAGSATDQVLTGLEDRGEWPPSPARLFSALVASDGTRSRCRMTDGSELQLIEHAAPPVIHAGPEVLRSPLQERFVVLDKMAKNVVHNYPARESRAVRSGTRLAPRDPRCIYVWQDVEPDPEQRRSLELRAARIAYLGAADAPARVRLLDDLPSDLPPRWKPDQGGATSLPVPFDGLLAALDDAHDRFMGGEEVRRSWLPSRSAAYRSPDQPERPVQKKPQVFWLRLRTVLSGHRALALTETLRDAVLSHYPGSEAPAVLHGHGMEGTRWQQAHYLPLVEVGHPFAAGRIHGAAVWLPADTPETVLRGVRTAVLTLRRLVRGDQFDVGIAPHDGRDRPWSAKPERWTGPSRRWVSATPVVHERHGNVDLEEVTRWCRHAGLPEAVRFRLDRNPLVVGGVQLRPNEVHRRYPGSRYSHLAIEFAGPADGPIAIGRGRQFGLGVMAPVWERRHG